MGVPLSPRVSSIEEGWRHPWSPHHRRGAPVEKSQNQGWIIIYPNPGMIHTCHPMIILQHLSTIHAAMIHICHPKTGSPQNILELFSESLSKEFLTSDLFMSVEEISYTSCNSM